MVRPPWKELEGAEMASPPDLSMQNGRTASHYLAAKLADMGLS